MKTKSTFCAHITGDGAALGDKVVGDTVGAGDGAEEQMTAG